MKIVLIGYRGTGKTTLGKALAKALELPFIDTDQLIINLAKHPISEIFEMQGETGFRLLEKKAISSIDTPNAVIACGGGAILDPENMRFLKNDGYCLWLTASTDTIASRISENTNRPPLTTLSPKEEIQTVLEQRTPIYAKYADHSISTEGKSINKLLEEIIEYLEKKMI